MFSLDSFLESEERVGSHERRLGYPHGARECLCHRLEKSCRAQVRGCTACPAAVHSYASARAYVHHVQSMAVVVA